jgi:hypothetical protein
MNKDQLVAAWMSKATRVLSVLAIASFVISTVVIVMTLLNTKPSRVAVQDGTPQACFLDVE